MSELNINEKQDQNAGLLTNLPEEIHIDIAIYAQDVSKKIEEIVGNTPDDFPPAPPERNLVI